MAIGNAGAFIDSTPARFDNVGMSQPEDKGMLLSVAERIRLNGEVLEACPAGWVQLAGGWFRFRGQVLTGCDMGSRFLFHREAAARLAGDLEDTADPKEIGRRLIARNAAYSAMLLQQRPEGTTVTLYADRFGQFPLFYRTSPELVVGDRALDVARHGGGSLNVASALCLAGMEMVPGRETLAAGVEQVKPGEVVTLRFVDGKTSVEREHAWRLQVAADGEADERALEEELESVMNCIADDWANALMAFCSGGQRIAIPLSGGLDSRLLVALFQRRLGNRMMALTYGDPRSQDVQIARRAARALGAEHRVVPFQDGGFLDADRRKTLASAIGMTTRLTLADGGLALCSEFGGTETGVFLPGHSGDGLSGSRVNASLLTAQSDVPTLAANSVGKVYTSFRQDALEHLLLPQHRPLAGAVTRGIENSLAATGSDFAPEMTQRWLMEELVLRRVLPELDIYRGRVPAMLPFFDVRLVDFFGKVPVRYLAEQRLYKNTAYSWILEREGVLWVPLQGRGLLQRIDGAESPRRMRMLARRIGNRIQRAISPERYERNQSSCPMMSLWKHDKAMREGVWKDIERGEVLREIFDMPKLLEYLKANLGRDYHLTTLGIWGLLTVELTGREFLRR